MDHIKTETRYDDLTGAVSINFPDKEDFNSFAATVAGVDTTKYTPIAMRAYIHHVSIVTIFALDRAVGESHQQKTGKLLVKKFKVEVPMELLLSKIKQIDFTLIKGNYIVEDFEVIN